MKNMELIFKLLLWGIIMMTLQECTTYRILKSWGPPRVGDYNRFPCYTLNHSRDSIGELPTKIDSSIYIDIQKELKSSRTNCFIVMKDDTIRYTYFDKKKDSIRQHNLFSITKSMVSALVGIAIEENMINSIYDTVGLYLGDKYPRLSSIKIIDLMDMKAGFEMTFKSLTKVYYGYNMSNIIKKAIPNPELVGKFAYSNISVQVLSEIISKATNMPVEEYFERKLWKHLLSKYDASWSWDSKRSKTARSFGGISMSPYDVIKFGQLYLHKGLYNHKQVVPSTWVDFTLKRRNKNVNESDGDDYNLLWRSLSDHEIYAKGFRGQYLYLNYDTNMIILRLGHKEGKTDWIDNFKKLSTYNSQTLKL